MHVSFFIGIFRLVAPRRKICSPDLEMKRRYFGISYRLRRKGSAPYEKKVLLDMNRVVRNYIEEKEGCRRAFSSGRKYRSVEKMPARHAEKCGGSKAPSLRGVHLIE